MNREEGLSMAFDRARASELVKGLGEEELCFLHEMITERLKLMAQAKSTLLMTDFHPGDRVSFQGTDGILKKGIVLRLNKKTVSLRTDNGQFWNVYPGFLKREIGSAAI